MLNVHSFYFILRLSDIDNIHYHIITNIRVGFITVSFWSHVLFNKSHKWFYSLYPPTVSAMKKKSTTITTTTFHAHRSKRLTFLYIICNEAREKKITISTTILLVHILFFFLLSLCSLWAHSSFKTSWSILNVSHFTKMESISSESIICHINYIVFFFKCALWEIEQKLLMLLKWRQQKQ